MPIFILFSTSTSNSAGTPDHHQRKISLKFIFVTPRQLIERGTEGKEMKEIRVNLYVPPTCNSASSTKYDLIGHKEDFRVNMQFALGTAMIGEGKLCLSLWVPTRGYYNLEGF